MKIAGLDIGTTGCKLTVFDESGEYLGKAYREYAVRRDMSGHEIDAAAVMDNEEILPRQDLPGGEECAELTRKVGEERITRITGLRPNEMYSLPKILWIKRHRPEIYAAAKHIYLIEDYAVWRLTGRAQIDYSLATRTMAFDINTLTWSGEIFNTAGIDISLMSEPVPTGTDAGSITPETAERTGLSPECRIISVSHDQVAAAVGTGALDAGLRQPAGPFGHAQGILLCGALRGDGEICDLRLFQHGRRADSLVLGNLRKRRNVWVHGSRLSKG